MANRRPTPAQRKRNQEAADWALRNREAEFSPEDLRSFHQWLDRDPENQRAYDTAEQLLGDACTAIKSDPDLNSFEAKPATPAGLPLSSLLGLALIAGGFFYLDGPMRLQADVISGVAELPVVQLEDGSTVYMNAESAIAFDFSDEVRNIRLLRGEAFLKLPRTRTDVLPSRPATRASQRWEPPSTFVWEMRGPTSRLPTTLFWSSLMMPNRHSYASMRGSMSPTAAPARLAR